MVFALDFARVFIASQTEPALGHKCFAAQKSSFHEVFPRRKRSDSLQGLFGAACDFVTGPSVNGGPFEASFYGSDGAVASEA